MSKVLTLTTLGDTNIERVLADPPLVWLVIDAEDTSLYEEARAEQGEGPPPEGWPTLDFTEDERVITDLDKAWHGLHYLFFCLGEQERDSDSAASTSSSPRLLGRLKRAVLGSDGGLIEEDELHADRGPYTFLLAGGSEVGDIEVGYGPARVFTAAETQEIQVLLSHWDDESLRAAYDPAEMRRLGIYPEIWVGGEEDQDEALEYCLSHFHTLLKFLKNTARAKVGLVIHLG